jgi:hypothetical protein
VLDDVERRRLAVQPARKDSLPAALRIPDVELDEGAGQLLHLPGRRRLAGAKPDDRVADSNRLARLQSQLPVGDVALVEKAQDGDSLGHRSRPGRDRGDGLRDVEGARLARRLRVHGRLLLAAAVAAGERGESDEGGAEREPHALSGVHAS